MTDLKMSLTELSPFANQFLKLYKSRETFYVSVVAVTALTVSLAGPPPRNPPPPTPWQFIS
jgi:hypothetical protein